MGLRAVCFPWPGSAEPGLERKWTRLVLIFVLAWGLLEAGAVRAAARKPYGGALQLAYPSEIYTTDPARVASFSEWELARQVHETLYRCSADGTPGPALAHFLPQVSADGKQWTIPLRPGLVFHDESPITSADVVASWERLLAPQTGSAHWWLLLPIEGALAFRQGKAKGLTGLAVVNKLTLRVRLRVAMPEFIEVLCALPTAPLSAKWRQGKRDLPLHPPGSGPFRWSGGGGALDRSAAELTAFPGHWQSRPYLDRLEVLPALQPRDAAMAFEMGKLHLTRLRPARREARPSLAGPANRAVFLLVHPRFAKAFPHGVARVFGATFQRQTMASFLSDVDLAPGDGVTACPLNEAAPTDGVWKKDEVRPPAAPLKDLPRRLELFIFPEEEWLRRLSQRIQVDLTKLGLSVEVKEVDREAILRRRESREYDLLLFEPLPLVRSALLQWISILSLAEPEQGAEEIFQVLRQWEQAATRAAMLADRARSFQARLPWFLLFCQGQRVWAQSAVRDLVVFPDGLLDYANVWLTE